MSDDAFIKTLDCIGIFAKWFILQVALYYLMPYLWNHEYGTGSIILMFLYTSLYVAYWKFCPKVQRVKWLLHPYLVYVVVAIGLYGIGESGCPSVWCCLLLPIYGLICLIVIKLFRKSVKRIGLKYKFEKMMILGIIALLIIVLKSISVSWLTKEHGSIEAEKEDIIERRNYLVSKLVTTPQKVLNEMPFGIGIQFQGEWALYSCSMLSAALVNISHLYPETKEENLQSIDSLIKIVMSPEMRYYDTMRWNEDPLESLTGDNSHVSYLSHLAWMICSYKEIGGDNKYDKLLASLCMTMNHRILLSKGLNLPTYPGESIYIPDMLVAIVALDKYSDMNDGKYRSTVRKWIKKAQKEWLDDDTGLLASFVDENGKQYEDAPVKGSYSALNCYYLTFIDETFAKQQHEKLKKLFWRDGFVTGLKEYWDRSCPIGLDMDAGPIILELSPSGTAFFAGSSTFFNDSIVRKGILKTAEIAGHTIKIGNKRHYLLANIALVGESIMLAMRTNFNMNNYCL